MTATRNRQTLYLIAAGWGLPEHLSHESARLLQQAALIFYEPGTEPIIDELAPESATLIPLPYGQEPKAEALAPEQPSPERVIVRLLLDRPEDENHLLREAALWLGRGFKVEPLPGLSIAQIARSLLDLEELSPSTVQAISRSMQTTTPQEAISLLSRTTAKSDQRWIVFGRTPFAGVRVHVGSVPELTQHLATDEWLGAVVVAGPLTSEIESPLTHLERLPLYGQRIVVTRARNQAPELVRLLRERGAQTLLLPAIRIQPLLNSRLLNEVISGLNSYDWVIFTSANGVRAFFERFFQRFSDARDFGGARIAAVGPVTAEQIKKMHLSVDLVPSEGTAEAIVRELSEYMSLENLRILLVRGERATPELPQMLEDKGAIVDEVACYRTVAERKPDPIRVQWLKQYGADWILFFSGSAVEFFHRRISLNRLRERFPELKIAVIGAQPTKELKKIGLVPEVEASVHTAEGLVQAIEEAVHRFKQPEELKGS